MADVSAAEIGLYGVMSYAVARRAREIASASPSVPSGRAWLSLVMKEVARLAVAGVGLGVVVTLYLARHVESQLFGLSPLDPPTLVAAVVLLSVVALLAGYLPARRATRVDPMVALRTE